MRTASTASLRPFVICLLATALILSVPVVSMAGEGADDASDTAAVTEADAVDETATAVDESAVDVQLVLTRRYVEVRPGVLLAVKGERSRRMVRFARLLALLGGDRLATYQAHGVPMYRHRENDFGEVTEHWVYPELGRTFVFRGDVLVRTELY